MGTATRWYSFLARPGVVAALGALQVAILATENLLYFPLSIPYLREATGGHVYLDMCAFCSADRVQTELVALGERGRRMQLLLLSSIDVVIPVVSCLFGVAVLLWVTKPFSGRRSRLVVGLPFVALALDLGENAGIAALLWNYPAAAGSLAATVGVLSGLKFVAYGAVVAAAIGVGVLKAVSRTPGRES